jgi:hypothetical protein
MLKNIAIVAALVAVGCGAGRPQRPTMEYSTALKVYLDTHDFKAVQHELALRDEDQAKDYVGRGIMDTYKVYNGQR